MALNWVNNEMAAGCGSVGESDRLPDSAAYIKRLESRLFQLKNGKSKEPLSKEMLSAMQTVREDHMSNFIQFDERNSTSAFLPETDGVDRKISASYIEKPELTSSEEEKEEKSPYLKMSRI